jgi:hypothetical protein
MILFNKFNNKYEKCFSKVFLARATIVVELITYAVLEISVVVYKELEHLST